MVSLSEHIKNTRIGYFCNFFNEKEALENHVKKMGRLDFDARIYIDGRFPNFPHKDILSKDGSVEVIKQMENVHLIQPDKPISEMDKNNLAFQKCRDLNLDFVIQCDADEWIMFDREVMKESFIQEASSVGTFQYMIRFTNHYSSPPRIVYELPRLFFKPGILECKNIHWWFYALGNKIVVDPKTRIEGCHMHHDDRLRTIDRNKLMDDYQKVNVKIERKLILNDMGQGIAKIGKHRHDYHIAYEAGEKCYICNRPKE